MKNKKGPFQSRTAFTDWDVSRFVEAAFRGDLKVVEGYLARGMDPDSVCPLTGTTALEEAVRGVHPRVVEALLKAGARPRRVGTGPPLPLRVPPQNPRDDLKAARILKALHKKRANVKARDEKGRTVAHVACERGSPVTALVAVALGVDPKAKDERGKTVKEAITDLLASIARA